MARTKRVAGVAVLGIVAMACRSSEKSADAHALASTESPPEKSVALPVAPAAAPVAPSTLSALGAKPPEAELIDAGAEPRKALRYTFRPGTKDDVVMTLQNQVEVTMNGQKLPPQPAPAMEMAFTFTVLDVGENRQARIERTVAGLGFKSGDAIPAQAKTALDGLSSSLKGLTATDTYTERGVMVDSKIDLESVKSAEMRPLMASMQQSFAQLVTPLPSEPVGRGARWKVPTHLEVNGMSIDQLTTFELVERTDEGGKLKMKVEQSGKPGPIQNPAAPGVSANLVRMSATGTGETEFEFSRPSGAGTLDLVSHVEMSSGSLSGPNTVKTQTKMHLEIRRPKP